VGRFSPRREALSDIDIIQELLDCEPVVKALGSPINARAAVEAVRDLRRLAGGSDGQAVAEAWNRLSGALGGPLTAALLSGPEWRSFCPITRPLDDYDGDDTSQVVWLGEGHRVIGRAVVKDNLVQGVKFTLE
jgi:hypothetical protein